MKSTTPRGHPTTAQTNVEAVKGICSALDYAFRWGSLPRFLHFVEPPPNDPPAPDPKKEDPIAILRAEFDAKFADQETKLNSAHALIRKLTPKVDPPPPDPKDGDPPAQVKKTAADKELDARIAKIEKGAERVAKNAKRTAVTSGFAAMGIAGDNLTDAVDLFMTRSGDNVIYNDEDGTVLFKHSEIDDPKPIGDYLTGEAKAGKFNRFKAGKDTPKTGPAAGGQGGGSSDGRVEVSPEESRKMLMEGTFDAKKHVVAKT